MTAKEKQLRYEGLNRAIHLVLSKMPCNPPILDNKKGRIVEYLQDQREHYIPIDGKWIDDTDCYADSLAQASKGYEIYS